MSILYNNNNIIVIRIYRYIHTQRGATVISWIDSVYIVICLVQVGP